jgi:hypothetical protein
MARLLKADLTRHAYGDIAASGLSPAGLDQFKLERLLELRALIDAMRAEQTLDWLGEAARSADRRPSR